MDKVNLYDDAGRLLAFQALVPSDTIVLIHDGRAFVRGFGWQNRLRFFERPSFSLDEKA